MVGFMGLAMDIFVGAVVIALQPFERNLTYALVAVLVGAGIVMTYLFAVLFPHRYERYYNRVLEKNI
jgi:hypothetical protein